MVEIEPVKTEEEYTLATGEKIKVTKYVYPFKDVHHILYDVHMSTPTGYTAFWRATESWIPDEHDG